MVSQRLSVTAIEKYYCSSSPREQAATAHVLTFNSYVRLSLKVVTKAYTKGPGCPVLPSGYCCTKDIGTCDNCFIFKSLHKAADVKAPPRGPPGQPQISLRVGVLLAMQVALVRGAVIIRPIKQNQRR